LYYTGYIGSTYIERIQVDLGSALSIIPKKLLYFLGIPLNRLSTTTTTIYGFNIGSSHPLGKIRLQCQIGDLKSEVTCYIIDADTSYNLLLGGPWIHANWIVPSTLHQCFKYIRDDVVVWMVFTEVQPFKEVVNTSLASFSTKRISSHWRNHCPMTSTVAIMQTQNQNKMHQLSIEPIVAYLNDYNCNKPAENEGEWVLNENISFNYSLCLEDVSVNVRSLHMPLLISEIACMHI